MRNRAKIFTQSQRSQFSEFVLTLNSLHQLGHGMQTRWSCPKHHAGTSVDFERPQIYLHGGRNWKRRSRPSNKELGRKRRRHYPVRNFLND